MPGFVLTSGSVVTCLHGGQAQATAPNPRVQVGGQPVVVQTTAYAVAGCAFVPPAGNGPCVTGQWVVAATRVLAGGAPLVLQDSQAVCVPTGTGLLIAATQPRVRAT
jgi:hypothetical protein